MAVVLVTGAAGYIGSHACRVLARKGYSVVGYDSLENGHPSAVKDFPLVVGHLSDKERIKRTLREYHISAVMHFAAYALVGESVSQPAKYFRNNTAGTLTLLEAMIEEGVLLFVLSSTAAVYGEPVRIPIKEEDPKAPTNPYGLSKLMVEQMLPWFYQAYGLRSVSLRYFNAAGADPEGDIGEYHRSETHLIPLVLQTALGQRPFVAVYGNDYPTSDGTCLRDFVHVTDLASAHVLALQALEEGRFTFEAFNLGGGTGHTVLEVIRRAEEITGSSIPYQFQPRRPGDPARLVASHQKAQQVLGWHPVLSDLDTILETAWRWHSTHPRGYED